MSNYIKIQCGELKSKDFLCLKRRLGKDSLYYLVTLWTAIGVECPDGILRGWDSEDIESIVDWNGVPGELVKLLVSNNYLKINTEGNYELLKWQLNNHLCNKEKLKPKRAKAAYIKNYGKELGTKLFNEKHNSTFVEQEIAPEAVTGSKSAETPAEPDINGDQLAIALDILNKYELVSVRTGTKYRNKTLDAIANWLNKYSPEILFRTIDNYTRYCEANNIKRKYMRRSYTFFGIEGNQGYFETFIDEKSKGSVKDKREELAIHANECYQSFDPLGTCPKQLFGKTLYCSFCKNTIHRSGTEEFASIKQ